MSFEVKNKVARVVEEYTCSSRWIYYYECLKIFAAINFSSQSDWPSPKEYEFLVYTLDNIHNGILDPTSKAAVAQYGSFDEKINTNKKVRARLDRLTTKMWFKKERKKYILLPDLVELAQTKTFNSKVVIELDEPD